MLHAPAQTSLPEPDQFKPWVFKVGLPLTEAEKKTQPMMPQKSANPKP